MWFVFLIPLVGIVFVRFPLVIHCLFFDLRLLISSIGILNIPQN